MMKNISRDIDEFDFVEYWGAWYGLRVYQKAPLVKIIQVPGVWAPGVV